MPPPHTDNPRISRIRQLADAHYPHYFDLFCHYNQHPEIGLECHRTARRQAEELRRAGFEATENVGWGRLRRR